MAVGALCFLVALVFDAVLMHQRGLSGDEPYYERMAAHPSGPHNFPYGFRIGVPYLVHVLPFSHSFSWGLLALLAIGGASGALFALLTEFKVDPRLAVWLAVCFCVSPPLLLVLLRNGRGMDAAVILVITVGTLFIVRRQRIALMVTLLAGATLHESCLFLIALAYAVWAQRAVDSGALRDLALVAVAPVLVYLYLRNSIVVEGEQFQPGYGGAWFSARYDVVRAALRGGGWWIELRRVFMAFGPLWFAAPFAVSELRFARRGLVLVALSLASMTYALDWGRAIFFSAPVVYVAAAYVLTPPRRRTLAVAAVALFLVLDLGYGAYMQVHGVAHGLNRAEPPARGPVY